MSENKFLYPVALPVMVIAAGATSPVVDVGSLAWSSAIGDVVKYGANGQWQVLSSGFNIDGGTASSSYGGITGIDGGTA